MCQPQTADRRPTLHTACSAAARGLQKRRTDHILFRLSTCRLSRGSARVVMPVVKGEMGLHLAIFELPRHQGMRHSQMDSSGVLRHKATRRVDALSLSRRWGNHVTCILRGPAS